MLHDILKDFKGSQDGRYTEQFKAGTQAELSDYLAAIAVKERWARPVKPAKTEKQPEAAKAPDVQNKAVATSGEQTGFFRRTPKQDSE